MLLNIFGEFFIYLKFVIAGDSAALIKYKELKNLYKTFKHSKYHYISKEKKITALFLQKVHTLYSNINEFKILLESTLFTNDEKKAQLYLNHFIESNLPEDVRNKREKFTKELMWKRIIEAENASKTMKAIEEEFIHYKGFMTKQNMPKIEAEYYLLYKLNSLATFNFEIFFSKFDPDYTSTVKPNYTPINGMNILNDLKDLYFLFLSIPQKIDLTSAFEKLYSRTSEDAKILAKKAQQSINTIFKLTTDDLAPNIILSMCKFISEDLKLRINVEQKSFSILDKYRKEIDDRFQKNKEFILQKYSEKSQQQDIDALFKGKHLLKFEGYSDDLVKLLEDNNYESISGIQAIRITKTFLLELYELNIKEILNTLILEAFYTEKEIQTEFSNRFFAANELKDYILGFEDSMSNSTKNSFSFLQNMLKNIKSTSATSDNKILKQIEIINEKIKHCNEKCAEVLYKLAQYVYNIIQDYKAPKPQYITNIKLIKGGQNKDFINKMASSYNDIAKYIKIIKNFISIES